MYTKENIMSIVKITQSKHPNQEYYFNHIELVKEYALLLNEKIGNVLDNNKLELIALSHDLLKEKGLDQNVENIQWEGHIIPQNTEKYVKENISILDKYGLAKYVGTDVQYHPLAAAIWLEKELSVTDEEILYPIMFHSCPIMDVYARLSDTIKKMIDVIVLADKLSSNYLCINELGKPVRVDLDEIVFGKTGHSFNMEIGVLIARLIAHGKNKGKIESQKSINYYYQLAKVVNPLLTNKPTAKRLGGKKIWQPRKSQVLKTDLKFSKML